MKEAFDVVVIGGGTAGLVTASGCARLGRRVALVDRSDLGGDCLWTGCVPTKALVASARLAHQMRHGSDYGLSPVAPAIDSAQVLASMREQRRVISRHDDPEKFRRLGIDVIRGRARFVSRLEVEVEGRGVLSAKDVVIATGSRTAVPPIPGLGDDYLDHARFLDQDSIPRRVVILGGGAIGVEFAQIFKRLGSAEVVVVEALEGILVREDPEMADIAKRSLEAEGIQFLTSTRVVRCENTGASRRVFVQDAEGERPIETDVVFVAAGRRGNVEDLGLDRAGVTVEKGYVKVDASLRTSAPRVWACGDVHGGLQFTHVAAAEAVTLVRNLLFPGSAKTDTSNTPWAVYTDPEIAHLGWTEPEARERLGDGVRVWRVPMADVDRAVVDRVDRGLLKIITDRKGRIVGAHLAGLQASALIATLVLARQQKLTIAGLTKIVAPYPSLADAFQRAGSLYYQELSASTAGAIGRRLAALWHR